LGSINFNSIIICLFELKIQSSKMTMLGPQQERFMHMNVQSAQHHAA
jgi:hypothetical protein